MGRDLGSASGEINITFDDSGTNEAQRELEAVGDEAVQAAAKAVVALKAIESEAGNLSAPLRQIDGTLRDVNGRLHDFRGRFIAEGHAAGSGYGKALQRQLKDASDRTNRIVKGILGSLGKLAKGAALVASLSVLGAVFAQAAAGAVALIGALAPLSGLMVGLPAIIAAAAVAVGVLKIALQGMGDAMSAAFTGDAEEFEEALKKLGPNARAFAIEVRKVAPALKEAQRAIQENLFEGLSKHIQPLIKAQLPAVRAQALRIAADFNVAAQRVAQFLRTSSAIKDVAAFMVNVRKSTMSLTAAVHPLVTALFDIVAVGGNQLPSIAKFLADIANRFAAFINQARATGQLEAFFQHALALLAQLGAILKNVGGIFGAVFNATSASGTGLLNTIEQMTSALSVFLNSDVGQAALVSFFEGLGAITTAVTPIIVTLAKAIGQNLAPIIKTLAEGLGPALNTALQQLGPALDALSPAAAPFAQALAGIVTALAPLLPAIGALAGLLLTQLANAFITLLPVLTPLIAMMGGTLKQVFASLGPVLLKLAQAVLPVTVAFGGALAQAFARVLPAVARMMQIFAQAFIPLMPQITAAVVKLIPPLVAVADELGDALLQAIIAVIPHLPALARATVQIAIAMIQLLAAIIPILPQIVQLAGRLANSRGTILTVIAAAKLFALSINGATAVIKLIIAAAKLFASTFRSVHASISSAISSIIGTFNRLRSGAISAISGLLAEVRAVPGKIKSALGSLGGLLVSAGADAIRGLISGISSMGGAVIAKARSIANSVKNTIASALKISSPSRVTAAQGRFISQGLIQGMVGSLSAIRSAAKQLTNAIAGALGRGATATLRRMQADTRRIFALAQQRDAIAVRLKAAEKNLNDLLSASAKVREEIAGKVRDSFKLVDSSAGFVSVQAITRRLDGALRAAQDFAANVAKLKARGLSSELLEQLAEAGPVEGAKTAKALVGATADEVARLNALSKQLGTVAKSTGDTVADSLFGAGIKAAQGLVAGLKAQQRQIEAVMLQIAKAMQVAIKRALGIRSPSRVMAGLGEDIAAGLAMGLNSMAQDVARAALALAEIPAISLAGATLTPIVAPVNAVAPLRGAGAAATSQPVVRNEGDINVYQQPGESATELARRLDADRGWRSRS